MNRINRNNVADAATLHHHGDDINLLHHCNLFSACLEFCLILTTSPLPISAGLDNIKRTDFMSLLSRYLNLFTGTLVLLTFGFPVWFDGSKFFETFNEKTDNVHSS